MKAKLTARLPEGLLRKARAAAALRGESISEVIRRSLQEYVEKAEAEGGELRVPK